MERSPCREEPQSEAHQEPVNKLIISIPISIFANMEPKAPVQTKTDTANGFRPAFTLTPEHVATSFRLARLDGAFERFEVHPTWLHSLRRDAYIRNAHSSVSIEGNPLDLDQARRVADASDRGAPAPKSADEREIVQHLEFFRRLESPPTDARRALLTREIAQTHADLLSGVVEDSLVGRLRGVAFAKFVYFGKNEGTPPLRVEAELDALRNWYENEGQLLPPPVRIAIWFHEFESIHPFLDGNGRVGRALTHRLLVSDGFPYSLIVALDAPFNANRSGYYHALEAGRNDLTPWVDYFLRCLEGAYDDAWKILRRLGVVPEGFKGAQRAVLQHIIRTGTTEVQVASLVRALEDYRPITITVALKALADEHGLVVHNGKRGRASAYSPTEKLFALAKP